MSEEYTALLTRILHDVLALQQALPNLSIQVDARIATRFVLFDNSAAVGADDAENMGEWMMSAFRASRALYTRTICPNATSRVWFLNPGVTPELVRFMITGALPQMRLDRLRTAGVQLLCCSVERTPAGGSTTMNAPILLQRFDGIEAPDDVELR